MGSRSRMIRGLLPHLIAKDPDVSEPTWCCREVCTGGGVLPQLRTAPRRGRSARDRRPARAQPAHADRRVGARTDWVPGERDGGRGAQPARCAWSTRRASTPRRAAVAQAPSPLPRAIVRGAHVCRTGTRPGPAPGLLTACAARWAIGQIRSAHASVQDVARQLGVRWRKA
jgi:transposase